MNEEKNDQNIDQNNINKNEPQSIDNINTNQNSNEMSSISTLFSKSFEIYKVNFSKFITLIIINIVGVFGVAIVPIILITINFYKQEVVASVFIILFVVIAIAITLIIQAANLVLIRDSVKNFGIKELLIKGKDNAVDVFIINFLIGVFTILLIILFIIPGIIFIIFSSVAIWAYMYEGKKGMEALKRSIELVKGFGWSVFGRFFAVWFVLFLISLIPFVGPIINAVAGPFFVVYSCFIYWDLIRLEKNKIKQ